ncbi:MBL fold metallo-hydrolase [Flavobacterium sp. GB2R13]|uniref:MBL fold metallo-hydrolase n=1 Tax=Flavobacterium algoris TaxID=3398733 RepID=UPI003A854194
MNIKILKAFKGDSILLSFLDSEKSERNILIDGGTGSTYYENRTKIKGDLFTLIESIKNKNKRIDLLILTHIDDDHIGGILRWFAKDKDAFKLIDKVWFNSGKTIAECFNLKENEELELTLDISDNSFTSVPQAKKFEDYLIEKNIWDKKIISKELTSEINGLKIKILTPTKRNLEKLLNEFKKPKHNYFTSGEESDWVIPLSDFITEESLKEYKFDEDDSVPNGSSITFILTFNKKNYVFLGDSHPTDIIESLTDLGFNKENPLISEILKVSHHGSCRNTNKELLEIIKTDNYIISSDGTSDNLPNKRTFSRIVNQNPNATIYFNYGKLPGFIFLDKDRQDFPNLKISSISEYI